MGSVLDFNEFCCLINLSQKNIRFDGVGKMSEIKDVFICHASEDKLTIIKPLLAALDKEGITYWYDEAEINWGDSIPGKVNEGLRISRYVMVILSSFFLSKNWPQRELNSALNTESSTGEITVLPLIVGENEAKRQIIQKYPIIQDKRYLIWTNNASEIVEELKKSLGRIDKKFIDKHLEMKNPSYDIPIPKIPKEFSQLDKDRFIKTTFNSIKEYFRKALKKLKDQYPEIEFDLDDIDNIKFTCAIYHKGDLLNKCKIWIGSPISDDGIAYSEGNFVYGNDGSYNDWFTVSDDEFRLGLKPSGFPMGLGNFTQEKLLFPEEAAKHLWLRFTDHLNFRR